MIKSKKDTWHRNKNVSDGVMVHQEDDTKRYGFTHKTVGTIYTPVSVIKTLFEY